MRNACQNLLLAITLTAWGELAAQTSERCQPPVGQIVSVQGSIELRRVGEAQWQPAKLNDTLCAGDMIRVKERSRGSVALVNETLLRLDQKTTVTLVAIEEPKPSLLELCRGAIHFMTRTRKTFRVITPFVNAAVEGTEFSIEHSEAQDNISVFEGQVSATSDSARSPPETCEEPPKPVTQGGTLVLASGESGIVPTDKAPFKLPRVVVRPENSVQWALYYPPLSGAFIGDELAAIGGSPEDVRDARFFTHRAARLLAVGRVDEARSDIQQALKIDPHNSAAYALQAIISVVQNDKAAALNFAQRAVQLDEKSSDARIALSYAQQANFEIEEALTSARKAIELEPENALAWARVAELELSLGELDRALDSAQRAASLNPNLARTQTVLGFANLTRIDIEAAKASFEKAIELDQADPLPRLGLGLAKIRESNLEAGRREIEIAASLDPADSLIRSYLGKAYFEERREKLAGIQFDIAKELDPLDPTPWFYDAIRKQTETQPVEALQDLEKSIELNDNRAVYRSGLLLDEDRATRGTSLARIYDDLGFDQPALVEASKSLSIDPANHSAHRFLSDTYARLPRHEIARVSELLQAQLLQPINVNPVQPRLSVTDLNIIAGAGPAEAAFNEFTPLFERNRPQFVVSGIAGNNDTFGDEAVLSGLAGRFSYSLGQFHYETDGFRQNNDLEHDIYNAFAQYALTPDLNMQAEYRRRETRNGDLRLNFDPDVFSPRDRRELNEETVRLGGRLAASNQSDVIVSVVHNERKEDLSTFFDGGSVVDAVKDKSNQAEAQYLFRSSGFNVTAGVGTYKADVDLKSVLDLTPILGIPCPPDETCTTEEDFTRRQYTGYGYANIFFPSSVIWTLGLSHDTYKRGSLELKELNPKVGAQWSPNDNIRLRFAAFETLKRGLSVNQTIEPTQVAGFNQFFDDANGTRTKNYGIGIDSRLFKGFYGGIEASRRDLEFPVVLPAETRFEDQREDLYRAYFYLIPHLHWALTLEYQFEKFEREVALAGDPRPTEVKTSTMPLVLHYFSPLGLFANFGPTYIHQEVEGLSALSLGAGEDSFVLLDAAIGYRLQNRRGIISLEGRNLLDKKFLFEDDNFRQSEIRTSRFIPARIVQIRATFSF